MKINITNTGSEAYHTGYEARLQGELLSSCPYCARTIDRDEWLAGWREADASR